MKSTATSGYTALPKRNTMLISRRGVAGADINQHCNPHCHPPPWQQEHHASPLLHKRHRSPSPPTQRELPMWSYTQARPV